MSARHRLFLLVASLAAASLCAQLLDPAALRKPPSDTWPTYNGDYSGQRHSPISQINASNVKSLTLAWTHRFDLGPFSKGRQSDEGRQIKATPLLVKGVLYFSITDHIWAADARTGKELWHYEWPDNRAIHVANRGLGMYGDWLYYMTPDNYLLSLNAKDGKERWRMQVADVKKEWFSSFAPLIIKNHVLTAAAINTQMDKGWLESRDPETGKLQWKWFTIPEPGEPGSETWTDPVTMSHGQGNPWLNGTYDPDLNLYYFGTGDAAPPRRAPHPNAEGEDSLYTTSLIALNPDSGKKVWHFQVTPHDDKDYDAGQTPILFDAEFNGQQRKLVAQVNRNGYYFLLDRVTGKSLVTVKYMPETNWGMGIDALGHVIPDHTKDVGNPAGTLVSPYALGSTNWWAPSYDPKTGLIFVNAARSWNYSSRSGGGRLRYPREYVTMALDYKTGKVVWTHELGNKGPGNLISGLLTTAGDVLFSGDSTGNFLAMAPATGKTLWHANVDQFITNAPMTYVLDGRQYILVAAVDTFFAFTLPASPGQGGAAPRR
jgi:acido-empty-quinoprotein group A